MLHCVSHCVHCKVELPGLFSLQMSDNILKQENIDSRLSLFILFLNHCQNQWENTHLCCWGSLKGILHTRSTGTQQTTGRDYTPIPKAGTQRERSHHNHSAALLCDIKQNYIYPHDSMPENTLRCYKEKESNTIASGKLSLKNVGSQESSV